MTQEFNTQERRRILAFVREVIDRELHNAPMPEAPEIPGLDERRSCFGKRILTFFRFKLA